MRIKDSGQRRSFETGAVRDMSEGKGRFDLIPPDALMRVAKHYENGAKKYNDRNWEKGIPFSSLTDSAMRHLVKYIAGWRDEDHLTAIIFNVFAMIHFEIYKPELNDLPNKGIKEEESPTSLEKSKGAAEGNTLDDTSEEEFPYLSSLEKSYEGIPCEVDNNVIRGGAGMRPIELRKPRKIVPENFDFVVKIDFDGTIVEDDYPNVGKLMPDCQEVLHWLKSIGFTLVLDTCRSGSDLEKAVNFCKVAGLGINYFNQNVPYMTNKYSNDPRKLGCDYSIDDRNVGGFLGWLTVKEIIKRDLENAGFNFEMLEFQK